MNRRHNAVGDRDEGWVFSQQEYYVTGIKEQSGLTFVSPAIGFVTVEDESGDILAIKTRRAGHAAVTRLCQDARLKGMEGVCYNRATDRLRVLSEQKAALWELVLTNRRGSVQVSEPVKLGELEPVGAKKNKGYEGLSWLPADLSLDGREWQLAIQESKPRKVAFFDPVTLRLHGLAKIPDSVKDALPDLSDVAVSPRGTLFVLSDQGEAVAELALEEHGGDWELHALRVKKLQVKDLPLGGAPRLQPEGICFDHRGDLWVACEGNGLLIRFGPRA
jgi:uncharacterized protein YjiK